MIRLRLSAIVSTGLLAAVTPLLFPAPAAARADQTVSLPRRTIWVQTMDSCRHALPAAHQTVQVRGGRSFVIGPGAGTKPVGVGTSPCPAPRGDCAVTSTGCVSFTVPLPGNGQHPVTYTISQNAAQAGPNTVPCNGGSACKWEQASFTVYPSGAAVLARVSNVYPDGTYSWYPSKTGYAAATRNDPILFHDFVLGNGSCDGDQDADDHLTGTPNSHCDDDADHG